MILAELEVRHSRAIAPTRRVALGPVQKLPADPAPGFGGVLLAGVVGGHMEGVDPDLIGDLRRLVDDASEGRPLAQPRLRYRFQVDSHGLVRTRHRLTGRGETLSFDFDRHDSPLAQVLGAVYSAGRLPADSRRPVSALIHRALRWSGPPGPALVAYLTGGGDSWSLAKLSDPVAWALHVLGFDRHSTPDRREVQRRFRHHVRMAHPDHGAEEHVAAQRVTELTDARRILLAV